MTTTNLPDSINTAVRAVSQLGQDVLEVCDVLAFAFGVTPPPQPPCEESGTIQRSISRVAGSLDALARTAEASSARLRRQVQYIELEPRPEPEQCRCSEPEPLPEPPVPTSETVTTPAEAVSDDDGEYDPIPVLGSSFSDQTDDDRKQVYDPGESLVVKLPDREQPREVEPQSRPRRQGKGKDARRK